MPWDGSQNYFYPPGTPGTPDQTIESEAYNTFLDDLVANDLNQVRPIHRGGTGGSTPDLALAALGAVKKSGDTMTGELNLTGPNVDDGPETILRMDGRVALQHFRSLIGGATYMTMWDGDWDGGAAPNTFGSLWIGGGNDPANYYCNTTHNFSPKTGAAFTIIDATKLDVKQTTASSSPTTGALTVAGGVGIVGSLFLGGLAILKPDAGHANLMFDPQQAAQQAGLSFFQSGAAKWQLIKQTDNSFLLYDSVAADVPIQVPSGGGTVTMSRPLQVNGGGVGIHGTQPNLTFNKSVAENSNDIYGMVNGVSAWLMRLGVTGGHHFSLWRCNDAGALAAECLNINRATGQITLAGGVLRVDHDIITNRQGLNQGLIQFGTVGSQYIYYHDGQFDFTHKIQTPTFTTNTVQCNGNVNCNTVTASGGITASGGFSTPVDASCRTMYLNNGTAGALSCTGGMWASQEIQTSTNISPFGNILFQNTFGANRWTNDGNFVISGGGYKPGGGSWADSSDERIKTVTGEYNMGLEAVCALRPVVYKFKGNDTPEAPKNIPLAPQVGEDGRMKIVKDTRAVPTAAPYPNSEHYQSAVDGKTFIGLIAQEVATVFPDMVKDRTAYIDGKQVTDLKVLDTGSLIFALVNAIKELTARVEQLEA